MIEAHVRERVFVITAHGEWDLATAPAMAQMLRAATSGQWSVIVVDLADVAFMDVAGCAPLRESARECQDKGIELFLVHPPRPVEQVLRVCDLAGCIVAVERLPHAEEVSDLLSPADRG